MTNATHTQGPWLPTARTGEGLTPATYVIEDADRLPVVMAWRAADARLIAAAPDLLAALERAYQKLGFWMDDDKWDDGDEAAMVQIWAAIAKAKGEQDA